MPAEVTPDSKVSVPVSSLFDQLDRRLDRIDRGLDNAATKADIDRLDGRLSEHHRRITALEESEAEDEVISAFKTSYRKKAAWVVAAVIVPLATAGILVTVH